MSKTRQTYEDRQFDLVWDNLKKIPSSEDLSELANQIKEQDITRIDLRFFRLLDLIYDFEVFRNKYAIDIKEHIGTQNVNYSGFSEAESREKVKLKKETLKKLEEFLQSINNFVTKLKIIDALQIITVLKFSNLRELDISNANIGKKTYIVDIDNLAKNSPKLEVLDISNNYLGSEKLFEFLQSFWGNTALKKLNISDAVTKYGDNVNLTEIFKSLANIEALEEIEMQNNRFFILPSNENELMKYPNISDNITKLDIGGIFDCLNYRGAAREYKRKAVQDFLEFIVKKTNIKYLGISDTGLMSLESSRLFEIMKLFANNLDGLDISSVFTKCYILTPPIQLSMKEFSAYLNKIYDGKPLKIMTTGNADNADNVINTNQDMLNDIFSTISNYYGYKIINIDFTADQQNMLYLLDTPLSNGIINNEKETITLEIDKSIPERNLDLSFDYIFDKISKNELYKLTNSLLEFLYCLKILTSGKITKLDISKTTKIENDVTLDLVLKYILNDKIKEFDIRECHINGSKVVKTLLPPQQLTKLNISDYSSGSQEDIKEILDLLIVNKQETGYTTEVTAAKSGYWLDQHIESIIDKATKYDDYFKPEEYKEVADLLYYY